ncbi:hypothetical protein KVR01_012317 [Diaporthe batatas]|uniref:uncharacterized protein n=1 Tax=Diaporthe batatas TaxID=748121 RepID=UPI001D044A7E|nr:uncharacterized protein KVR01_012317 [Diaporthe batatas]KAG8157655.1 hypothetical protein KVR01_012317 [Diaporthe batatas]
MVSYTEIQASNAMINDATAPRVAVFVGGTSGIGQLTIKALVATGASARVYLVGRKSSEERSEALIRELRTTNPKSEVIWVEGEISLLAETKRVCEVIKRKETRVDLLFLTAGYAPFGPRRETSEGVEIAQSLEYYSRVLCILQLLPLMEAAESPRVVSVLAGGMEWSRAVNLDDLDLKKPGNFSGAKAQIQYTAMNTMALERLAGENPNVTFIHSTPGWVSTGNVRRGRDPDSFMAWVVWAFLEPIITLFSFSHDESGQRHLFESTSAAFGGRGVPWQGRPGVNSLGKQANGLFLASSKCDCSTNARVLPLLREKTQDKIWEHTLGVLGPYS